VNTVIFNNKHYDYLTLQVIDGFIALYGWSVYPEGSVLAGQQSKQFLDSYDDIGQAKTAHPDVAFSNPMTERVISYNHLPGEDL